MSSSSTKFQQEATESAISSHYFQNSHQVLIILPKIYRIWRFVHILLASNFIHQWPPNWFFYLLTPSLSLHCHQSYFTNNKPSYVIFWFNTFIGFFSSRIKCILLGLAHLRAFIFWPNYFSSLMSACFFLPVLLSKLMVYITLHSDWTSHHSQTTLCSFTSLCSWICSPSLWNILFYCFCFLFYLVNSYSILNTQTKCNFLYETVQFQTSSEWIYSSFCASKELWASLVARPCGGKIPMLIWLCYILQPCT